MLFLLQSDENNSKQNYSSPVLIKRLLTPRRLQSVASLQHLTSASDTELQFTAISSGDRLLRVTLDSLGTIPPETLTNLTIYIQVHFLQSQTSDTDPHVALCDGTTCNGVSISDGRNYPGNPCVYFTATPGLTATNYMSTANCNGETVETNTAHPKTVSLSLVPSERWGSFSIPEGNGFTSSHIFGSQLDPTQGLSVEMYGYDTGEQYRLAYMIVEVVREE